MEYWSFSCVLINHKGGRKKKCCCNEICSVRPTAGVLTHSAVDQPKWLHWVQACCRGRLRVRTSHLAQWASRLCLPDTHWWLNGCVWVQDDDLAWRRRHAGQRWRADIRAGWFDGDKKGRAEPRAADFLSLARSGQSGWRWVTAAQMHNIPQPKSPCTLFSYKEPIYYKYCHEAYRAVDFVASPWTQRCFQLETAPECHYVSEASTSCMKDCCDFSYGYYYMLPSLCCYIRQALTLGNQPSTGSVCW